MFLPIPFNVCLVSVGKGMDYFWNVQGKGKKKTASVKRQVEKWYFLDFSTVFSWKIEFFCQITHINQK
jgi:hypothetical protein